MHMLAHMQRQLALLLLLLVLSLLLLLCARIRFRLMFWQCVCVCVCYDGDWAHLLLRPHFQAKLRNNVRKVLEGMFEKFEEVQLQAMFR